MTDTDYKAALDVLRSDLKEAKSKQEELRLECEGLHIAVQAVEKKLRATASAPRVVSVEPVDYGELGVYVTMSMPEAIRHCLVNSPNPLSKRELMVKLREGGKQEGHHFSQSVYNTLHRLSRNGGPVRKDDDGRWSWTGKADS